MSEKKKQTRKAISVRGLTYQRVKNYCRKHDRSISGYVEEVINDALENVEPVPQFIEPPARKREPKKADPSEIPSAIWTF
jgi:hypothetical protein